MGFFKATIYNDINGCWNVKNSWRLLFQQNFFLYSRIILCLKIHVCANIITLKVFSWIEILGGQG